MKRDWKTWSPFQSRQVREICAHMNDAEKGVVRRRSALYGLWAAASFAAPLSLAMTYQTRTYIVMAIALGTVHIVVLPFWWRSQRRFLCSTAWAHEQGITPDQLKLFGQDPQV